MKILAFVDTHGDPRAIKELLRKSKEADLLVCAGDITSFGHRMKEILTEMKKAEKPMLIITGNHEMNEELRYACSKFDYAIYFDNGSFEYEDYIFFGYGGGGFARKNPEFENIAKKFAKTIKKGKKIVLVTHAPPYGTKLDDLGSIGHRGCESILNFIKKYQPILNISGHLHDTAGAKQMIGKTLAINPGPAGKLIKI